MYCISALTADSHLFAHFMQSKALVIKPQTVGGHVQSQTKELVVVYQATVINICQGCDGLFSLMPVMVLVDNS